MTLCIFTLNLISRSSYLKEALWSPPESEPTAHRNETRSQPSETPNQTRCALKRIASCTQMERTAHRNETRCAPEWNTLLTLVKPQAETRRAWKTKRAANLAKPPNRTRCAESETNRTRCAESETNRTTYPLETRGTKMSYLSNLSSLHLQLACPTSWWEKPAHATRKNQNQNRPLLTERPILTGRDAWTGRVGGKNAPREKGAWTMQVREPRMAENRASAVIDSSEKFL